MKQMTDIAIEVAELRAENKLLKSFNDSLIQALHKPVVMQAEGSDGVSGAAVASSAVGSLTKCGGIAVCEDCPYTTHPCQEGCSKKV